MQGCKKILDFGLITLPHLPFPSFLPFLPASNYCVYLATILANSAKSNGLQM